MGPTEPSTRRDGGDLGALLSVLRRRSPIILLSLLISVAAAVALTTSQPDRFRSTSSLLFKQIYLDAQLTGLPLTAPGDAARDAETNVRLVDTGAVRARVAARLGGTITASSINEDVTVTNAGSSNLVEIAAAAGSPEEAVRLANAMATEFVAYRRGLLRSAIEESQAGVRQQIAVNRGDAEVVRTLRIGLRKLQLLAASVPVDVQIASLGTTPRNPFAPKPVTAGIIGGFIGLVVGLALALVAEQLDRRLRRPEQVVSDLQLPVLSQVPRSKVLRRGEGWQKGLPGTEAEAFRRLRANLRYAGPSPDVGSVLVSSASPASGKTTVALHLALAAAGAGGRVLLIEADLRRPRLHELLDQHPGDGLSTILLDPAPDFDRVERFTTQWSHAEPESNGNGNGRRSRRRNGSAPQHLQGSLEVLLAGPPPPNPSELLDSEAMRALLGALQRRYDLIVIDGPPAAIVSDTVPLAKQVDGVVLVTRLNRETRDDLEELRAELERLDVRVFGVVTNFSRRKESAYYTSVT